MVAFSGGVDSTVLAKLARDALGKEGVVAVTADSASLAREDLQEIVRLANELDVDLVVIRTGEVENPLYQANTSSRCFFCKQELFEHLQRMATARGIATILYGAIGDDAREDRPGSRAAQAYGVRAPLQELGVSKTEVRAIAKRLGLSNWDRPQNACLSSRIPHGQDVTAEKLRSIERAEAFLRQRGFRQVRVRHLGHYARIEVGTEDLHRFDDDTLCQQVARYFQQLGFEAVKLDRAGYRAGGANQATVEEQLLSDK